VVTPEGSVIGFFDLELPMGVGDETPYRLSLEQNRPTPSTL
jgi:hypothetical protein